MKRLLPPALILALALTGCTPPAAEAPAPSETPVLSEAPAPTPPPGPPVYTDYSQLTPYEKPQAVSKFTRRYEGFTDALIPADDYGPLLPFPGATVTRSAEGGWGWMDDYSLYGLMTLEGEVVVDPVFSSAFHPSLWDETGQSRRNLDCLILQKVVMDGLGKPVSVAALCAGDGSWCTDFVYQYDWEISMGSPTENAVPMMKGDHALAFLDPHTGEELRVVDFSRALEIVTDIFWNLCYNVRYDSRYVCFSDETNHYILDTETGEVRSINEAVGAVEYAYGSFSEGLCPVKVASGWGYIDGSGSWAIAPAYEQANAFENGHALVADQKTGYYACIDHGGKAVFTFPDGDSPANFGGFISYQKYDGAVFRRHFLDRDLKRVPLPDEFTDPFQQGDWFIQALPDPSPTVPGGYAFWNYKTGVRQDFSDEWDYSNVANGDRAILNGSADSKNFALADLNTGEITPLGRWSSAFFTRDELTGETLLCLEGMEGAPTEWRRLNGDTLYTTGAGKTWAVSFYGGKVLDAAGEDAVTLTDTAAGELLFSWPLRPMAD